MAGVGKGIQADYWNSESKKDAMYVLKEPHQHKFIDISLQYLDMEHRGEGDRKSRAEYVMQR